VRTVDGFVERKEPGGIAWVREDLAALPLDRFWEPVAAMSGAKGRGGVGTMELAPGLVAVVRPLRRGGALAGLLGDRYPGPSRVHGELTALVAMRQRGVPVVTPLAAVARRKGAFWQLRLFTELEAGALPLPAFAAANPQDRSWAVEAAAVAVRLAFSAGLDHPDLHPDNLLVSRRGDRIRAVLVDLDKAKLRTSLTPRQTDAMLVRMARYLWKHRARLPVPCTAADRMRFLRGLGLDRQACREAWQRLDPKLRRAVAARGLRWR
jgi:hypothetical protein